MWGLMKLLVISMDLFKKQFLPLNILPREKFNFATTQNSVVAKRKRERERKKNHCSGRDPDSLSL